MMLAGYVGLMMILGPEPLAQRPVDLGLEHEHDEDPEALQGVYHVGDVEHLLLPDAQLVVVVQVGRDVLEEPGDPHHHEQLEIHYQPGAEGVSAVIYLTGSFMKQEAYSKENCFGAKDFSVTGNPLEAE